MLISRITFLISFALCLIPCFSRSYAGDFTRPTAVLERSSGKTILLSVRFAKLNAADLTALEIKVGDADSALKALVRLLDICVVENATTECGEEPKKARYFRYIDIDKTLPTNQSENVSADVDPNSIVFVEDPVDLTQTLTAQIRLETTDPNAPFTIRTFISTKITYSTVPEIDTGIPVTYSKGVLQAPQNPGAFGSVQSLTVVWESLDQVSVEGGGTASPSGVLAILVPVGVAATPDLLPSYVYNADFDQQTVKGSCSINVDRSNNSCNVECTTPNQLIVPSDLDSLSGEGVKYIVSAGNVSAARFSDLSNDQVYAVVLQYQPDGLQRSCVLGLPSDALILTQISTGKQPTESDSYCFVATAAYGSPLYAQLDSLRWFRNRFLLPYSWGMDLVKIYYRYGPLAAAYIGDKPALRTAVRGLLWAPVTYINAYRQGPGLTLFVSLALFIGLASLVFGRRERSFV